MMTLYICALALGLPLLLFVVFSGGDDGFEFMFYGFSLTTVAVAATFFGGIGIAMYLIGVTTVMSLIFAVTSGVISSFTTAYVLRWLRTSEVNSLVPDRDLEGSVCTVSVPISQGNRGQVIFEVGGARTRMSAKIGDGVDSGVDGMEPGDKVIIIAVESNVAVVAPLSPELAE